MFEVTNPIYRIITILLLFHRISLPSIFSKTIPYLECLSLQNVGNNRHFAQWRKCMVYDY